MNQRLADAIRHLVDAVLVLADLPATPAPTVVVSQRRRRPSTVKPTRSPALARTRGARTALKEVLLSFGPSKPADAIRQVLAANATLTEHQVRRAFHSAKAGGLTSDEGGVWRWLTTDPTIRPS